MNRKQTNESQRGADKQFVGDVFARAAPHYDAMNDALSFGAHRLWKRLAAQTLGVRRGMRVLDAAGGSGDMAKLFAKDAGANGKVVLADINDKMLNLGARRCSGSGIALCRCDAEKLPFADGAFDRACAAFGLRNIKDRAAALKEMRRVLCVGGKMLVLEFSPPQQRGMLAAAQRFYLRRALPFVGGALFGDAESYRYLGDSILRFPPPHEFAKLARDSGFAKLKMLPLAGGIVNITTAWKLA